MKPGVVVCVHGLQADGHLNGLIGTCTEQLDPGGILWAVELETGEVKNLKVENLVVSLGQTRVASRSCSRDGMGPKISCQAGASQIASSFGATLVNHVAPIFSGDEEMPPDEITLEETEQQQIGHNSLSEGLASDTSATNSPLAAPGLLSTLVGDNSPPLLSPAPDFSSVVRGDNSPPADSTPAASPDTAWL
jgi:hypothetical protein